MSEQVKDKICPECKHKLEFMISYYEGDYIIGLFYCDKCGSTWKIKKIENEFEEIERYFFG